MYHYLIKKLFIAVVEGDLQQLKNLVNLGANINHVFPDHGDTLLHYAHTPEVASFLLLTMAKSNVRDKYGQTPLCCAAARPNGVEVVKVLIAAGADVNAKMINGKTPLHYAPNLEITQVLLKSGAQVNAIDKYGRTPLHASLIEKKGLAVFKCLLDAGADINARMGDQKNSVLHYADSLDIVREILSRGFDINTTTTKKHTPLHHAVKNMKELPVIRQLLICGANVNMKDHQNDIPIHYAIRNYKRDYAVIQILIEYGSNCTGLFQDIYLNRRANCLGYMLSRDMELSKLIAKTHVLRLDGNPQNVEMPRIAPDACPKADLDFILDYIQRCAKEIPLLKKHYVFGTYSLYNVAVNKKIPMKPVFASYRKLQQELQEKYPYFHEIISVKILPYLHRGRLLNKLKNLQISVKNDKKKIITINPDCTKFIIRMLPDCSLSNLLRAAEL